MHTLRPLCHYPNNLVHEQDVSLYNKLVYEMMIISMFRYVVMSDAILENEDTCIVIF
jgi:hypothetical protein